MEKMKLVTTIGKLEVVKNEKTGEQMFKGYINGNYCQMKKGNASKDGKTYWFINQTIDATLFPDTQTSPQQSNDLPF